MAHKLSTKKVVLSKGRTTKVTVLEEEFSGPKAKLRKKILDEFSLTDQLRVIRKAILSGDKTQLEIQDNRIDDILKGFKK